MAVATTIPRYAKNQLLLIDDREVTLINYLKELRLKKGITKKKISNLIKHNDYWYSQVERNGKNGDDNRQRTIYETDLINIISILQYDALTYTEIKECYNRSEIYLTKILKAVPLKDSIRQLELYEIQPHRTFEEQERLFASLMETQQNLIKQTFNSMIGPENRDNFLTALKNMNVSLKIDPLFLIFLAGLPFADFLYEYSKEKTDSMIREILMLLDKFSMENDATKPPKIYLADIRNIIIKYTGMDLTDSIRPKIKPLPPDQVTF